jgi:hypothetical protein
MQSARHGNQPGVDHNQTIGVGRRRVAH